MAYTSDKKPSELSVLTDLADDDTIVVGDTSDTSEVVKAISWTNLKSSITTLVEGLSSYFNVTTGTLDDITAGSTNKHFTATDETKLDGIATGATANDTDANLLDRTNHTGTQDHSTISDYDTELAGKANTTAFTPSADYHVATKKYVDDNAGGGGASELSDLSDVNTSTPTNRNVLIADGVDFESRALVEADISDLGTYQTQLTEGAFVDGDKTKLDGIEAGADVTDTANVTAAGALMDSEVDANIKTLSLPANTTITTAAQTILDDTSTTAIRTTLGVGTAQSPQFTAVNIGHATDTTISRVSAGKIAVEGVNVVTTSSTDTLTNKTLTAPVITNPSLTDVQEVRYDATPDTDHTVTGPTTDTINAGATIAIGELVYVHTDGEWALADASATGTAERLLGIAMAAGTDGNPMLTALPGSFVRDDTWAWTVGAPLYISETAGDLTETAPSTTDSVVRVVGYAVSADVVYFMPQQGVVHV